MEETVGLVSTCGRELLRGWRRPIGLMVSFMVFTASVRKILDPPMYSPYPPPACLDVTRFAARCLHVHNDARDPSSERWKRVGEDWPVILPEIATSTSIQESFTCRKSATWDWWLYFPSEGRRAKDFFALKNPDGFSQVWTRELGYLKAAHCPYTTEAAYAVRILSTNTYVKIHTDFTLYLPPWLACRH